MIEKITACVNASKNYAYQKATSIYELVLICIEKVNELVDFSNGFQAQIDQKENIVNITNNRKLSVNGDFTGTWFGNTYSGVFGQVVSNSNQIEYLSNQFADGRTGLVVDGGFFEETGIKTNYDGGRF